MIIDYMIMVLSLSLYRKVVTAPFSVSLAVERTKGLTLDTSILYSTEEPSEPVTVGQVTFEPAQAGSHFTLVSGASVIFTPNKVCFF